MIGYVTLGTNDLERAAAFYDALLSELGAERTMEDDRFILWSVGRGPGLAICTPFDGEAASVGNGVMPALAARSKDMVDKVYRKAIELGATDEGPAGQRTENFYGGYFRDLDGNKLTVYIYGKD